MHVLNFGSLNIDHTYRVESIALPGMTVDASGLSLHCGGKGLNQSVAIARAGTAVSHAGAVGQDGAMLLQLLDSCNVDTRHVAVTDGATGHAVIQVSSSGENAIVILGGANQQIDRNQIQSVLDHFSAGDYIVLQNEIANVPYIIRQAHNRQMVVCFNPSPMTEAIRDYPLDLVDYLFINETEGMLLSGQHQREHVIEILRDRYPRCNIIFTLGKDGVIYAGTEGTFTHGIFETEVVDTTGAGDTFCGFFIACICQGHSIPTSLKIASKASSLCVSRPGAAPSIPSMEECIYSLEGGLPQSN